MKINMIMDKHKVYPSKWCGTREGLLSTLRTIIRGYRYGYRRFEFGRYSK